MLPVKDSIDVADGWAFANISDVKAHLSAVKNMLRHENRWVICSLADGWIMGRSYGYRIRKGFRRCAHKIVVKCK